MRALAITTNGKADASNSEADVQPLIDKTGSSFTARPGARADCVLVVRHDAAFLVAEASKVFLIVLAYVAVMQVR